MAAKSTNQLLREADELMKLVEQQLREVVKETDRINEAELELRKASN